MGFQVYKLHFKTRGGTINHQALFLTDKEPHEGLGWLHHVIDEDVYPDKVTLSYNRKLFDPKDAPSLLEGKTVQVGIISESAISSFDRVCENVGDVSRPYDSQDAQGSPNCVSWVNNAVYDLIHNRVLSITSPYKVPARKEILQVKSASKGSSSGKAKGSSSGKAKGSSSRSK